MFPLYNSVKATIKEAITLKMCIYFPHPQLQLRTSHSTIFSPLLRKVIKNIKKEIHSIFIKTYIIPLSQFLKISLSCTHYTHCIPVVQLDNSTILFLNMRGTIILSVMACTVVSFYTAPKILKHSCLKVTKNESLQYWQVLTVSWGWKVCKNVYTTSHFVPEGDVWNENITDYLETSLPFWDILVLVHPSFGFFPYRCSEFFHLPAAKFRRSDNFVQRWITEKKHGTGRTGKSRGILIFRCPRLD